MSWTAEQIEKIPEAYRDFMIALKAVPDTRDEVLKINAIPLGRIFNFLRSKYAYEPEQVNALGENLRKAGFVDKDNLGFFWPTTKGEDLIEAISGQRRPLPATVPPLPDL
jgi:hypothetical protein